MTITITLKGMILTILAVLGMILLVYLILLIRKLIGTLKGVDAVLKDAKTVSSVAADQAENLDDVIEGAALAVRDHYRRYQWQPEHCCSIYKHCKYDIICNRHDQGRVRGSRSIR